MKRLRSRSRSRITQCIATFMLAMYMLFSSSTPVLASNVQTDSGTITSFVKENAPVYDSNGKLVREGSSNWTGSVSSNFSTKPSGNSITAVIAVDTNTGASTTYYYDSSKASKVVEDISSVKESDKVQTRIDDMTDDLGIQADTKSAAQSLSGATGVVNYIVGIIVVLIDLGLILYTSFDVCYLLFPVLRNKMEEGLKEGKGINVRSKDGENTYRFVSDEAVNAYNKSVMGEGKKAPYTKYFMSRIWAYIAVAVITYVLLSGNISIITKAALKLASGALDLFSSLF